MTTLLIRNSCFRDAIFYLVSLTGGGPGGGAGQGRAEVQREAGQRPPHGAPAAHALQRAADHGRSIERLGYSGRQCSSSPRNVSARIKNITHGAYKSQVHK
jgi:hypothetical protein